MEKDKVKIQTKTMNFTDVEKALKDIEVKFNDLNERINSKAETEVSERTGQTGDIKSVQNADKSYSIEIKTEDGWKKGHVKGMDLLFEDKPKDDVTKLKKSIDEIETDDTSTGASNAEKTIFDEKDGKFKVNHLTGIPRPDYDSGWVALTHNSSVVLTHNLELTEHPRLTQHYKSTSATPVLGTHNIYDGAYTWDNSGCMIVFTGANTIKVWSDNSAMGGSGNAFSHDSAPTEDGSRKITTSGHIRVMLWK